MKLFLTIILLIVSSTLWAQRNRASAKVQQNDTVYTRPEVLATYPGGEKAWKKYVKRNLKYPRKAWWDEIESDMTVKVIIEKNGRISDAYHMNISNYGFEREAVRLVKKSGKWLPAKHKGMPVKSEGELTIQFRLK